MSDDKNDFVEIQIPDFAPPYVETKLHEIVNPVQLAFRAALLPILLENTALVKERMASTKTTLLPEQKKVCEDFLSWVGSADSYVTRLFTPLLESYHKMEPGTIKRFINVALNKTTNAFMPFSVVVPMKAYNGHDYMLRFPHIVLRSEGNWVKCLNGDTVSNTQLYIEKTQSIPASPEEVHAVVESLTPTAIGNLMVHSYCRPILDTILGVKDETEDETTDKEPF